MLIGILVGLAAAWAVGIGLASLLYQVRAGDALTLLGASGLLIGAGLLASYWPAARASRFDPANTLRTE